METHLIGDLDQFGIPNNDYETFLTQRGKLVIKLLKERLNPDVEK